MVVGRIIVAGAGVAGLATGSTLTCAYVDPDCRRKVEEAIPQPLKPYIDLTKVIGEPPAKNRLADYAPSKIYSAQLDNLTSKTASAKEAVMSKLPFGKSEEKGKVGLKPADDAPLPPLAAKAKVPTKKTAAVSEPIASPIDNMIRDADRAVDSAVREYDKVVHAVERHTVALRKALDAAEEEWSHDVAVAMESLEKAQQNAVVVASTAKSAIERLTSSIEAGEEKLKEKGKLALDNCTDKLHKAEQKILHAMDKGKALVAEKGGVDEARQKFARELKSVVPNIDVRANIDKLTDTDFKALISHAHKKIDTLTRQLVHHETNATTNKAEVERDVTTTLRRQTEAHVQHLEQSLANERARVNSAVLEAKTSEKMRYFAELEAAIKTLQRLNAAVEGRAEQDEENRRSKDLWLACVQMREAVQNGRRYVSSRASLEARRQPLANAKMGVEESGCNNPFVNVMLNSLSDDALHLGVYNESALSTRFKKVDKICRRTALLDHVHPGAPPSLMHYALSLVRSLLIVPTTPKLPPGDDASPDLDSNDTLAVLSHARSYVQASDYENAVKTMLLLRGEPRRLANGWIRDTRTYLETKQIADLLLAHATAIGIRTIY